MLWFDTSVRFSLAKARRSQWATDTEFLVTSRSPPEPGAKILVDTPATSARVLGAHVNTLLMREKRSSPSNDFMLEPPNAID